MLRRLLKAGAEGAAKSVIKGKGEALDMPPLPLALSVRVQLVSYTTVVCWEAEYRADGVIENSGAQFSGKPHVE